MIGALDGRSRTAHIAGLVIVSIIGVVFALACLGGITGAAGSAAARARAGQTFGSDIGVAIGSAVIVLACVAGGVHFEHRLRRHQPVAQSWSAPVEGGWAGVPWVRRRAGRRYSPVVATIHAVLFTGLTIGMLVGTFVTHSEAAHSSRVQHHGVLRSATVASVHNTYHSSRGGGYYTATVRVYFVPPLDGSETAVVHFPGHFSAADGSRYSVLLDPSHPGYAELPGYPATRTSSWILMLVFTVFFAGLSFLIGRSWYRMWRHRRGAAMPAIG